MVLDYSSPRKLTRLAVDILLGARAVAALGGECLSL